MILLLISTLLLPTACKSKKKEAAELEKFPVRVEKATKRDLEETVTLVGTIKAKDEATLFSRVPGKLLQNQVKEGDPIRKGDSVALVERDEVGVKFEPAPVPSTLNGVVARTYLDRGANVTLATPIALVVDPSQLFAKADLPERYVGRVSLGQDVRVRVDAQPDREFKGKISRFSPVVDTSTRSTYLEARLEESGKVLRSGMFAKLVVVIGEQKGALSVPVDAIPDEAHTLFVENGGKAYPREVQTGIRSDSFVEIKSGLREGEAVITFGLFGLKEGSDVEILP
jgi:membrane fusion protein, multidrug efflux system